MVGLSVIELGGAEVADVSAGGAHTCVVLLNGGQRCWGANVDGQLGLGTTAEWGSGTNGMRKLPKVLLGGDAQCMQVRREACHFIAD
jgi:alpha-tubulin suppressor-like RCC1 family protein